MMDAEAALLNILEQRDSHRTKAWASMGGYKFWMFGYHASGWVKMNQLLPTKLRRPNPFKCLVHAAREEARS